MSLIVKNLSKSFGDHEVLHNLSFELNNGEITGILGANGAGKTTLFNILSNVISASSGTVIVNGIQSNDLSPKERAKLFSVVPQLSALGGAFTVEQVVMLGRTPYMSWQGSPSDEDLDIIQHSIKLMNLRGMEQKKISHLSGGEQQRVIFARALSQETPILLLDEPTNNLDIKYQIEFFQLIKEIVEKKNKIVLMALHDLNFAGYIFDRVIMLKDGKINGIGEVDKILTSENIENIYGIKVLIEKDRSGKNRIIPLF